MPSLSMTSSVASPCVIEIGLPPNVLKWTRLVMTRAISGRVVFWGLVLQWAFALLVLRVPAGVEVLKQAGEGIKSILDCALAGSEFVFGKALVDAKLAQSANMGERALHDPGLITLTASLNKDQSLDAAKKAMIEALSGVIKNPPTQEEVERVRTGAAAAVWRM